jgi:hypothetical protein
MEGNQPDCPRVYTERARLIRHVYSDKPGDTPPDQSLISAPFEEDLLTLVKGPESHPRKRVNR